MKKILFCLLLLVLISSSAFGITLFYESCDAGNLANWYYDDPLAPTAWYELLNHFERGVSDDGIQHFINKKSEFTVTDFNLSYKVRPYDGVGDVTQFLFLQDGNGFTGNILYDGNNGYQMYFTFPSRLYFFTYIKGVAYTKLNIDPGLVSGTWYDINVSRKDEDWFIYLNGTFLGNFKDLNYTENKYVWLRSNVNGAAFDEILWTTQIQPKVDLNIDMLEGYSLSGELPSFNYTIDNNLTIDFNVFNIDNNVMFVDINYSTIAIQGTGTVIVNDFNLSSDFCTNAQQWNVDDSNCNIDWHISGVPDGNYYILIDLNGGSQSIFKAANKSMYIYSTATTNIDVNIISVDNYIIYPIFNYATDGNITLKFKAFNIDNKVMTFDLNYGATNDDGTGVVIAHDVNLGTTICANAQRWNVDAVDCYYDWNIMWVPDGNYYLKIKIFSDTNYDFEATANSMHITQPYLRLHLFDENFGYPLVSQTVTFNGINYTPNSSGLVDINIPAASGVYTVTVKEDGNYPARYFDFDLNATSRIDLNVFMLQDDNGQNVSFKFYNTDQTTTLPSVLVRLRHDNNICSMRYTGASGETSFFLDPDDNYVFEIVKSATETLRYYPTQLTINIPKNESTLANITPFGAAGSLLTQKSWVAQSASLTYYILANTVSYYSFDFNATDYNPRNYLVSVKGNPATHTLQAYLSPKTIDGETVSGSYTFIVTNSISLNPISNVLIIVKRNIPGLGETEIASITTDSAGQATTTLQYYVEYNLYFYYLGQLVFVTQNTPTPTPPYFQVQLAISAIIPSIPILGVLSVSFKPFNHNIFLNSIGLADVNINVSLLNKTFSTMRITLKDSASRIISEKYFTGPWTDGNLVHFDLNLLDFNRNRLLVAIVDVNSTDGNNYHADFGWSVFEEDQWAISNILSDFASSNDKVVLGFIALFITLIAVGAACITSLIPGDPLLLSLMTIFILFFWVSIGFLELVPVLFIALFMVFLALLTKAVM